MKHIKIIVQGKSEMGEVFARRIEELVLKEVKIVSETKGIVLDGNPSISMTSAQDGKLTATIQFTTKDYEYH